MSSVEIRNEKFQRIVTKIEALEHEAMQNGFVITSRALNQAKNALGWEVTGALDQADLASKGKHHENR